MVGTQTVGVTTEITEVVVMAASGDRAALTTKSLTWVAEATAPLATNVSQHRGTACSRALVDLHAWCWGMPCMLETFIVSGSGNVQYLVQPDSSALSTCMICGY